MTKENIYYMDDNAFDRFYKRARYQANSFVAGKIGSKVRKCRAEWPNDFTKNLHRRKIQCKFLM